jgi:hypothetical protein
MSNKRYVFTTPGSASFYAENVLEKIKIYQISAFPNPKDGKFEVREVVIDGDNNIETWKLLHLNEKTQQKLLKALRDNKYRLYSVFSLRTIDLPDCNDIALARSDMLNMDNDYSGFARFDGGQEFNWRGTVP